MSPTPPGPGPARVPADPWFTVRPVRWRTAAWAILLALAVGAQSWDSTPGFTTDSDSYMDAADNLHHGLGLVQRAVDFTRPRIPDPFALWPPLYPMVIAGAATLGLPVDLAARLVSACAFALFLVALFRLASAAVPSWIALAVLLVLVRRPLAVDISNTAWSESLYLALLTLGVLAATELPVATAARPGPGGAAGAVARGLLLGLACLTRYAGLPLVAVLILLVATGFVRARPGLRKGAWALGALLPPLAWSARNAVVSGGPFGPGLPPAEHAWRPVLGQAASVLRWEFVPPVFAGTTWLAVAFLAFSGACAGIALARGGVARVLALLAGLPLAMTVWAVHAGAAHEFAGRYMAPVLAFGVATVATVFTPLARRLPAPWARRVPLASLLVLYVVWLLPGGAAVGHGSAARAARADREARLVELVRLGERGAGTVCSDAGHLVRTATGRSAVEIPAPSFAGRAFTRADRARWEAMGVHEAILTRGSFAAPAFADWVIVDSSAHFERRAAPSPAGRVKP